MRRTKADRWERMADNMNGEHVSPERLAYELRREHRAVVRMVKSLNRFDHGRYDREDPCGMALYKDGAYIKLDDVLDRLKARAR